MAPKQMCQIFQALLMLELQPSSMSLFVQPPALLQMCKQVSKCACLLQHLRHTRVRTCRERAAYNLCPRYQSLLQIYTQRLIHTHEWDKANEDMPLGQSKSNETPGLFLGPIRQSYLLMPSPAVSL